MRQTEEKEGGGEQVPKGKVQAGNYANPSQEPEAMTRRNGMLELPRENNSLDTSLSKYFLPLLVVYVQQLKIII